MDVRIVNGCGLIELPSRLVGGEDGLTFSEHVRELIDKGITTIVLDCNRVELINSSGLGMLVAALGTLRSHGGTCILAAVPERMRTLLDITHLDLLFILQNSVIDALNQ